MFVVETPAGFRTPLLTVEDPRLRAAFSLRRSGVHVAQGTASVAPLP